MPTSKPAVEQPRSFQAAQRCAHCGHELRPHTKFCGHCGQAVAGAAVRTGVCPTCGQAVRPGAKFCGKCGQEMQT